MDEEVECVDCGWIGYPSELTCSDEDDKSKKSIVEISFNRCPNCDSTDIVDVEGDED